MICTTWRSFDVSVDETTPDHLQHVALIPGVPQQDCVGHVNG
jgi:hypothetical protein